MDKNQLCNRHVLWDPYDLSGQAQQRTTETVAGQQIIEILHPHHPLYGERVGVVRALQATDGGERRWLIEDERVGRVSLPQSWARVVQTSEIASSPLEISEAEATATHCYDLPTLLKLARLLQSMRTLPSQEPIDAIHTGPPNPTPSHKCPANDDLGDDTSQSTTTSAASAQPSAAQGCQPIPSASSSSAPDKCVHSGAKP